MALMEHVKSGHVAYHCDRCLFGDLEGEAKHSFGFSLTRFGADAPEDIDLCESCVGPVLEAALGISRPEIITDAECCIGCASVSEGQMSDVRSSLFGFKFGGQICDFCLDTLQRCVQTDVPPQAAERAAMLKAPSSEAIGNKLRADLDRWEAEAEKDEAARQRERAERERQYEHENERITRTFSGHAVWGATGYLNQVKALAWQMGLDCDTISQGGLMGKQTLFRVSGPRKTINRYLEHLRRYG